MSKVVIPGWVYMLLGVAIILYSRFIEAKTESNLVLFMWVGILFLIWGFFREIRRRMFGKKRKKPKPAGPPPTKEHAHNQKHPAGHQFHGKSHHETHVHTQQQKHPSHPHEQPHKRCPRCHSLNPLQQKLCHKCAWQFF